MCVVHPPAVVPAGIEQMGANVCHSLDAGLDGVDVVILLRLQKERMLGAFLPSLSEFHRDFGLTRARIKHLKPDAIIMHPTDFLQIRLSKASTSGLYLAGEPFDGPTSSLWGVPVVQTSQCTQGLALVANLGLAARIYWREFANFQGSAPGV